MPVYIPPVVVEQKPVKTAQVYMSMPRTNNTVSFLADPTKPNVKRFEKVGRNLYRGGQPSLEDIKTLSKMGVKTIVNLRGDMLRNLKTPVRKQRKLAKKLDMNYIHIAMPAFKKPTQEQVDKFLNVMKDSENHPVYVHCRRGRDRTGLMVAVYKLNKGKSSYEAIKNEFYEKGYDHKMFPEIGVFLDEYYNSYSKLTSNLEN